MSNITIPYTKPGRCNANAVGTGITQVCGCFGALPRFDFEHADDAGLFQCPPGRADPRGPVAPQDGRGLKDIFKISSYL